MVKSYILVMEKYNIFIPFLLVIKFNMLFNKFNLIRFTIKIKQSVPFEVKHDWK